MQRLSRKCQNCADYFRPDRRSLRRQRYCSLPHCRLASRKDSQRRWLQTENGREYFSGESNTLRVREWRKEHPKYWKRAQKRSIALQDVFPLHLLTQPSNVPDLDGHALQDILQMHSLMLLGLARQFAVSPKKEIIDTMVMRLILIGRKSEGFAGDQVRIGKRSKCR